MSQDPSTSQSQRKSLSESASQQLHGSFPSPHVPNLIGASAFGTSPYGVGIPSFLPPTQGLLGHSLSFHAPQFSSLGYPYLAQLPGSRPSAMASIQVLLHGNNNEASQPGVEMHVPKEYKPPTPARVLWPNYAPGYNSQPMSRYSRLPPNDVARKAPRKSGASSPPQPGPPRLSNGTSNSKSRRMTKQEYRRRHNPPGLAQKGRVAKGSTPRTARLATSPGSNITLEERTQPEDLTPLKNQPNILFSSAHSKPGTLDDEDEEDDDDDDDVPLRTLFERSDGRTSTGVPRATTPKTNTPSHAHAGQPRALPQPRYRYPVPDNLRGVQQALGEDNWTDYIILIEKKILKEITDVDFVVQSKAIFMALDDRTGKRIEGQVTKNVVSPVIEQQRQLID